jgi:hypothetical protein
VGISDRWSRESIAWAAGLFEGEGCISISGNPKTSGRQIRLRITSTDVDVLEKFRSIIGMGSISGPFADKKHPTYKPKWYFDMGGGKRVYAALVAFWPHLCARRRARAEEAIAFFASQGRGPKKLMVCGRGHEFTPGNTGFWVRGRFCKECKRLRNADRYNKLHPLRKRGYYKKKNNVPLELHQPQGGG